MHLLRYLCWYKRRWRVPTRCVKFGGRTILYILIALLGFQGQGNARELFIEGMLEGTYGTHAILMKNNFMTHFKMILSFPLKLNSVMKKLV